MASKSDDIGFIGVGIMGKHMASNLISAGYKVTVFNRSKKSVTDLVALGATSADTSKDVASASDVIIDMVTDAPDVEQVMFGKNGVIDGARRGSVVIDMSTNSPEYAVSLSSRLSDFGLDLLDAPVSGGDKGAKEATLTIMAGGKKDVFHRCKPILEEMGKTIVYMGNTGTGQATKLCNQVAVSINTLATCEALMLGASTGLDLKELLKVLTSGAAGSWNLSNLGPKIVQRDFEPGFKAAHLLKDLRYIIQLSERNHISLPGSSIVHQLFNSVLADKEGEKGTQILAKALEKLASREIG